MAPWIEKINDKLDQLGLYPDVEAYPVQDARDHLVLVDTQEVTVYTSHEGVYRLLRLVEPAGDERETYEAVGHALHPTIVENMRVVQDADGWRQG